MVALSTPERGKCMVPIVGILVVFAAVIGGFLMEKGKLVVLLQPAELLTIGGAALGTLVAANPMHVLKGVGSRLIGVLGGSPFTQQRYLHTLKMMFDLFSKARKDGLVAIEADVEDPTTSTIFSQYSQFLNDPHARHFVCDTMRMAITGGVLPFDLDQMMELDMDVHHHSLGQSAHAISTVADALPGLGIVAAVLGIVITMGALGGPPEEIGRKVAAALVGTFLGILLCYGVLAPLASVMGKFNEEENAYYHILRVMMLAFMKGTSPILAVELARRAIPAHLRPSFGEVDDACRNRGGTAATA